MFLHKGLVIAEVNGSTSGVISRLATDTCNPVGYSPCGTRNIVDVDSVVRVLSRGPQRLHWLLHVTINCCNIDSRGNYLEQGIRQLDTCDNTTGRTHAVVGVGPVHIPDPQDDEIKANLRSDKADVFLDGDVLVYRGEAAQGFMPPSADGAFRFGLVGLG